MREKYAAEAKVLKEAPFSKFVGKKTMNKATKVKLKATLDDVFSKHDEAHGQMTEEEQLKSNDWKKGLKSAESRKNAEENEKLSTEMIALKWDDKTSQFIAKYEDKSSKSGFILKHDLSLDFLEEILDPLFVHLVMQTPNIFMDVPIGSARDEIEEEKEQKYLSSHKLRTSIIIQYHQGEEDHCLCYGMASCLYYLKLYSIGEIGSRSQKFSSISGS